MLQKVNPKSQIKFGTDGMRGKASDFDLLGIENMGYEIAQKLPIQSVYVIGRDTRESGNEFYKHLKRGILSANRDIVVEDAGIVPTPLISLIATNEYIEGASMITASHNPFHDNGFKFFDSKGRKIPKTLEEELQLAYHNSDNRFKQSISNEDEYNKTSSFLIKEYVQSMKDQLDRCQLKGKIAIDCANGATYEIAKEIFQPTRRGLEFELFANEPNGKNINSTCGVTNPHFLEEIVRRGDYTLGISFDGDGDRVGFVDEEGNHIDGDFVLAFLANDLKKRGELSNDMVVVTQYSNLALDSYLKQKGITTHRVENGDKAVMDELLSKKGYFGGEKSGHLIFGTQIGSGDGIKAATNVLKAASPKLPISKQLNCLFKRNSQVMKNIALDSNLDSLFELPSSVLKEIQKSKEEIEEIGGRVLIRPSGTEPKIRILVESENEQYNETVSEKLSKLLSY